MFNATALLCAGGSGPAGHGGQSWACVARSAGTAASDDAQNNYWDRLWASQQESFISGLRLLLPNEKIPVAELLPGIRASQRSPGDLGSERDEEGVPILCWGAEGK